MNSLLRESHIHQNDATPYPALNTILHDLTAGIRAILGDNLIGAYLQDSFAIGNFDRNSDCDFVSKAPGVQSIESAHNTLQETLAWHVVSLWLQEMEE